MKSFSNIFSSPRKNADMRLEEFVRSSTNIDDDTLERLRHHILLFERPMSQKPQKVRIKKSHVMSKRQKKLKGLNEIPKDYLKYDILAPMNDLWLKYANDVLGELPINSTSGLLPQTYQKLLRMDFHGCLITVVDAKCNSFIGLTGIVLRETMNTFFIVTKDNSAKYIPKLKSNFCFKYKNRLFTLYGSNFRIRPEARCNKKFKKKTFIDCFDTPSIVRS